jgi:CRISPR system Cascade subunit CasE
MNAEQPLYLSRARLKTGRGEALSALAPVLLQGSKGDTVSHAHRILWTLFQQNERDSGERDFLWREQRPGHYLILSRSQPDNGHALFDIETKEFAPELKAGDLLSFALRANPVVSRKHGRDDGKEKRDGKGRVRGMPCDVVMDALKPFAGASGPREDGRTERARKREDVTAEAALNWMRAQGERHGFKLAADPESGKPCLQALAYETVLIPRMKGTAFLKPAKFGVLDLEGRIEVADPGLFLGQLAKGFGKAKAFGCGLMLLRRA